MAQRTKVEFEALYGSSGTLFPDNTTGDIGANDVRGLGQDSKDSAMFISDNFIDEDSFATDSATKAPSQQSTKAYIASQLSSSGAESVEVTLDPGPIQSSNSSPITIVAAPGANYVLVPIMFFIHMDYYMTPYATHLSFRFEINGVAVSGINGSILGASTDKTVTMLPIAIDTSTDLTNQAIVFEAQTGDPTAGDSILYVTCVYKKVQAIIPP